AYQDPTNESFYTPIVEATVFAEGNNKEYIIIKQHPGNDRKVINYFILPISKKIGTINNFGLMGPLTLEKFNQKKKKLKIEKLDFTIVYRDLE
ncbi:MAG: hypothetical protein ACXVB6_03505, partial [Mucilaginibacter sp.]